MKLPQFMHAKNTKSVDNKNVQLCTFLFLFLQDDTYTESYISTIGVDFVSITI